MVWASHSFSPRSLEKLECVKISSLLAPAMVRFFFFQTVVATLRLQKEVDTGNIVKSRVANSMVEYSAFNRSVPGSSPGQPNVTPSRGDGQLLLELCSIASIQHQTTSLSGKIPGMAG